jgi:hypothetical protein
MVLGSRIASVVGMTWGRGGLLRLLIARSGPSWDDPHRRAARCWPAAVFAPLDKPGGELGRWS